MSNYLIKQGQKWSVKVSIPSDVQHVFGKKKAFKRTLGTSDRATAISRSGPLIALEGTCASLGRAEGRTVGWLLEEQQAGFVPVYLCRADATASYLASANADCEGLGTMETRLGYGLAQ